MSELSKISEIPLQSKEEINALPLVEQIIAYAPILIKVLKIIKFFTGSKADAKIDQVIEWLELISLNPTP